MIYTEGVVKPFHSYIFPYHCTPHVVHSPLARLQTPYLLQFPKHLPKSIVLPPISFSLSFANSHILPPRSEPSPKTSSTISYSRPHHHPQTSFSPRFPIGAHTYQSFHSFHA